MIFWDSSAILPLLAQEPETSLRERYLDIADSMTVWWGCRIECYSTLHRKQRDGELDSADVRAALARLGSLAAAWREVIPTETVRLRAERLLKAHPLRAADALQLAAALVACSEKTADSTFYTSDLRLKTAAAAEGFTVP